MFCCTLLYVNSSIAIILMGKRKLVALLNLSSWCLVMVERPFLAMPWGCLRFVIGYFLIILTIFDNCVVSSKHFQCACRVDTPRVILLVTVFFIIQPDKHGTCSH